jgi:uncharacterized FAD-dependent dehydrogenase
MSQIIQIQITPEQAKNDQEICQEIARFLHIKDTSLIRFKWKKRSLDARKRQLKINATLEVFLNDEVIPDTTPIYEKTNVVHSKEVHIIGAGPAGLYAALQAIQRGVKPVLFERGKEVRARRRDLAALNKDQIVNPESNYCFGEGGAGTYSDGKLYTRSKKRGDVEKAMQWLVAFGADEDILVDAHPHIGTNKLPKLIENIRNTIIECRGEVHFEAKMTDIHVLNGKIQAITINDTKKVNVDSLVLATGHSARDVFYLLHNRGIKVEAKPFALGVRIEHTQDLIDKIQYHGRLNDDFVPPASYSLVAQVDGRGVYSFCMCPGGIIAPCATEQEEVVTNGWSPSKRNNPYSNSGIVVSISPEDFKEKNNPFVCLDFQKSVEKACWEAAGKTQRVPAQCMKDFVEGEKSVSFPRSSYQPGIVSVKLDDVLPKLVSERLKKAFIEFGRKMPGYLTNDAVLHAPESRTSSPIQIPRDRETMMHPNVKGLFPCAEGAGYAGGIISAAVDGMKCMDEAIKYLGIKIQE